MVTITLGFRSARAPRSRLVPPSVRAARPLASGGRLVRRTKAHLHRLRGLSVLRRPADGQCISYQPSANAASSTSGRQAAAADASPMAHPMYEPKGKCTWRTAGPQLSRRYGPAYRQRTVVIPSVVRHAAMRSARPNPSLHLTGYSGLRPLPPAGELQR